MEIDLAESSWEDVAVPFSREAAGDSEWIQFEVSDGKFKGSSSMLNLNQLLLRFLSIVQPDFMTQSCAAVRSEDRSDFE